MTKKQKADALQKLLDSAGWQVLQEQMEASILQAAYQLVEQRNMPLEEVHFRRGSIWAARKFLDLPSQIKSILDNDLLMDAALKAESQTKGATAPE
jgi:hypothetical protein